MLALLLFLPAWSLRYWEAWVYWSLFSASVLLITLYFLKHDPRLIERRLEVGPGAERERSQKVIQAVASLLLLALFVIPGLDHRFHGSAVPAPVVLSADGLVAGGIPDHLPRVPGEQLHVGRRDGRGGPAGDLDGAVPARPPPDVRGLVAALPGHAVRASARPGRCSPPSRSAA